jgi:phage terminase large subunit-like protein
LGDVAGALMAAAQKPLEPWQQDALDIMMSTRDDGRWACAEYAEWVARQNGKGGLGEARVLASFLLFGDMLIIWSAHEVRTSAEAFERFQQIFAAMGEKIADNLIEVDGVRIKIINQNGDEGFKRLDTGQRIKFISRSKSALRGFTPDLVIIDEAFAYTAEQQEAIQPTMNARPNGQTIYLSSPPLSGDTGEVMFSLRERAENALKGEQDSLGYRDWGAEGDLDNLATIDMDDVQLWASTNPALGAGRVTFDSLRQSRMSLRANGGRGFAREVLGIWPARRQGGGFIDMKRWADLLDAASKRDGNVAIAVDISPSRDYACISLYGLREDGRGHGQIAVYAPDTDWLVDAIVEWRNVLNPVAIAMGPATYKSLKVELEKRGITVSEDVEKPKRGDILALTAGEIGAAAGKLLDAVKQGSFRHIGQAELTSSIEGTVVQESSDGLRVVRGKASADTSPFASFSEAMWAFEARNHLVDQEDEPFNLW